MATRREILQIGMAAASVVAANGLGPLGRVAAQQRLTESELLRFEPLGNITLLHIADLHGQRLAVGAGERDPGRADRARRHRGRDDEAVAGRALLGARLDKRTSNREA